MTRGRHTGPLGGGTIRSRLARILALPAAVVLVLFGIVAGGQIGAYRTSESTARAVDLTVAVQHLVNTLQTERGITSAVLGGNESFGPELAPARQQVDQQRAGVRAAAAGGSPAEAALASTLTQLDGLDAVRSAVDSGSAGRAATFAYFTDRITTLAAVDLGLAETGDAQLRQGVTALNALQDLTEAAAQERAFLNGVFSAGGFGAGEFVQFAAMRAERQNATAALRTAATDDQIAGLNFALSTGAAATTDHFEQVAVEAADGRPLVVNPQSWWSGMTTVLSDLDQLQQHIGSQIQVRAFDLRTAAVERLALLLTAVVLTLVGSIYLAALASRSITRPLAALATEADTAAVERLPAAVVLAQAGQGDEAPMPPVPVQVPDRASLEIQSVAAALDRMQTVAYDLATEQALQRRRTVEALANLGRRNQSLIRRQLGFITTLEREEIDPQALSNLFELDHLATRMRRNADSLLVLVGSASPRRWSTPVPVSDVIRAAVSEVEEYRRVTLRRVDEAMVTGTAVGSVAHLLSELVENGLAFSPPNCEVEIQGRQLAGGYLVAITDQGVGMTTEELHEANSRLRGEGDFIAAPTRFLGHYVVGELARQLDVRVELMPSPVVGITARVTLPQDLLAVAPSLPAADTPAGAPATARPAAAEGGTARTDSPTPDLDEADADTGEFAAVVPDAETRSLVAAARARRAASREDETVVVHVDVEDVSAAVPATPPRPMPVIPPPLPPDPPEFSMFEPPAARDLRHPLPPAATIRLRPDRASPTSPPPADAAHAPDAAGTDDAPDTAGAAAEDAAPGTSGAALASADGVPEPAATGGDPTRTRNGLLRRIPREARPLQTDSGPARQVIDLTTLEATRLDHAPSSVTARLNALRSGIRRGQESYEEEQS